MAVLDGSGGGGQPDESSESLLVPAVTRMSAGGGDGGGDNTPGREALVDLRLSSATTATATAATTAMAIATSGIGPIPSEALTESTFIMTPPTGKTDKYSKGAHDGRRNLFILGVFGDDFDEWLGHDRHLVPKKIEGARRALPVAETPHPARPNQRHLQIFAAAQRAH